MYCKGFGAESEGKVPGGAGGNDGAGGGGGGTILTLTLA